MDRESVVDGVADAGAQQTVEDRAAAQWAAVEQGALDATTAMGEMEDWELRMGEVRLVLVPSTREWLWYDPVHATWELTGYHAGEATFTLANAMWQAIPRSAVQVGRERTLLAVLLAALGAVATLIGTGAIGGLADFERPLSADVKFVKSISNGVDGSLFALVAVLVLVVVVAHAIRRGGGRRAAVVVFVLAAALTAGCVAELLTMPSRLTAAVAVGGRTPGATSPDTGFYFLCAGPLFTLGAAVLTLRGRRPSS